MLFLGIISWKGVSYFNGGGCFSDGGASFLSGGVPHEGASVLVGGGGEEEFKKIIRCVGCPPCPPPTMGNPEKYYFSFHNSFE